MKKMKYKNVKTAHFPYFQWISLQLELYIKDLLSHNNDATIQSAAPYHG
jgi:hypothetical protein